MTRDRGGTISIVNLSTTPMDYHAAVVVHGTILTHLSSSLIIPGYVDQVMKAVMEKLGIAVPEYNENLGEFTAMMNPYRSLI